MAAPVATTTRPAAAVAPSTAAAVASSNDNNNSNGNANNDYVVLCNAMMVLLVDHHVPIPADIITMAKHLNVAVPTPVLPPQPSPSPSEHKTLAPTPAVAAVPSSVVSSSSDSKTAPKTLAMPPIGFGTFRLRGDDCVTAVAHALRVGYRHIDTAQCYGNERFVAAGIAQSGVKREDIYITSKLDPKKMKSTDVIHRSCVNTLIELGTHYCDLFLIHWPGVKGVKIDSPENAVGRRAAWLVLERFYREGKFKAIGVSNYTAAHLAEMKSYATIMPSVNQVEYHPMQLQSGLAQIHHDMNIQLMAYSSLGQGASELLTHPSLAPIAAAHGWTTAQLLLAWALQRGVCAVLPRSSNAARITSNIAWSTAPDRTPLTDEEMTTIAALSVDHHFCWNSTTVK